MVVRETVRPLSLSSMHQRIQRVPGREILATPIGAGGVQCQRRSRTVWADLANPKEGASGLLTRENAVDRLFPVFL